MIVLFPEGGLGNQLFQYSAALTLSKLRKDDDIIIDREFFGNSRDRKYELNKFKFPNIHAATLNIRNSLEYKWAKKIICMYRKYTSNNLKTFFITSEKMIEPILCKAGIYVHARHFGDKEIPLSIISRKNIFLWGYFLRPRFVHVINQIELKSKNPRIEIWKRDWAIDEHVCVHIRLGDFVNNEFLDVCTKDYYYRAMNYIAKKIEHPIFHIFSDDLGYVRKEFKFLFPVIYEEEKNVSMCMMKMSLCKHFILSNSTFSYWAWKLSQYKDKITVAPIQWFRGGYTPFHLYDKTWIRIKP